MAADFIFMLTREDRTIRNPRAFLPAVVEAGVRRVGFKDIGLPVSALRSAVREARLAGAVVHLELVSLDAEREAASAQLAVELGVDVLMGGARPEIVVPIIAGSDIRYYPFAGKVEGHPSRLEGSVDEILRSADSMLARDGVDGLNLLAYRSEHSAGELISKVSRLAGPRPVIVAGSINSAQRIRDVAAAGAAAFTIGSAVFEAAFPAGDSLRSQLQYIRGVQREQTSHGG